MFTLSLTTIGINEAKNTLANKFRPYKSKTTPSTFFTKLPNIKEGFCSWGFKNSFTDNEDYDNLFNCLDKQKDIQKFSRNIFLIGDSHSTSIAPGVHKYSLEKKYNFIKAAHVYCPFRLQYSMNWAVDNSLKSFSCSNFNKAVFAYLIKNADDGDVVFLLEAYISRAYHYPEKIKKIMRMVLSNILIIQIRKLLLKK